MTHVECTAPFSYEHASDPTLSTPPGMWVLVCSIYPMVGDQVGIVISPDDFSIVDARGQVFAFRPFPITVEGMESAQLIDEFLEPGGISLGTVTFTGLWSDLETDLDFPLRLEWSPEFMLLPNPDGLIFGDYGTYDKVEVSTTLFTIIEEPYPANVVDYDS